MDWRVTNPIEDIFKLHFWCYCFLGFDTAACRSHFKAAKNAAEKTIQKEKNNLFFPHSLGLFRQHTISIIRTSGKLYLPDFILWNMLSRN